MKILKYKERSTKNTVVTCYNVGRLNDPESYTGGNVATGRTFHA